MDPDAIAKARERALVFIRAHGDELAQHRAQALVERARAPELVGWLAGRQHTDGSFSDAKGERLATSRRALAALVQVGVLRGAVVEGAAGHLAGAQHPDGRWEPAGDASESAAIEATGRSAGVLARTPCVRTRTLDAAAEWLAARFAPERVQGFASGALAAYAAAFANIAHEDSDAILQWCGRELERGYRAGAFDAVRTARVLVDCDAPSLPGARLAAGDLVVALLGEQAPDGGWRAAGGEEPCRIARTLDALAGLARLAFR